MKKKLTKKSKHILRKTCNIKNVMMKVLDDLDYRDAINNMISTENVSGAYAVSVTGDNFSEIFAGMDDDYMKARAADVLDISHRVVKILTI